MRKIILFLLLFSNAAWAAETKISCNINLRWESSEGVKEEERIEETLEISTYEKNKIILANQLVSINTFKNPETISLMDISSENKFDISIHARDSSPNSKIETYKVNYIIDRNTGKIFYKAVNFFKDKTTLTATGNGNCEKVNVTRKKF